MKGNRVDSCVGRVVRFVKAAFTRQGYDRVNDAWLF